MHKLDTFYPVKTEIKLQSDDIFEFSAANANMPFTDDFEFDNKLGTNVPRKLNKRELVSIHALIAYISETQKLPETSIHSLLELRFGADRVEDIRRHHYQGVIESLVHLQDSGSLN